MLISNFCNFANSKSSYQAKDHALKCKNVQNFAQDKFLKKIQQFAVFFPLHMFLSFSNFDCTVISKMPDESFEHRLVEMLFVLREGNETEHAEFQVCPISFSSKYLC